MIESSFDLFLGDRGMAPSSNSPSLLERGRLDDFQTGGNHYGGVVSPSLESMGNETQECSNGLGTHSMFEDLKLGVSSFLPFQFPQDDSLEPISAIVEGFQPQTPAYSAPVCSISTSDSAFINLELADDPVVPSGNVLSAGNNLPSIQELEPFTDSIISLFGSHADSW